MLRDQSWFEMRDLRNRPLTDAVWIPLRASTKTATGDAGHVGYECEFVGYGSVAFPPPNRKRASRLSWSEIGLRHNQRSHAFPDSYKPADAFQLDEGIDAGVELALDQDFGGAEPHVWHLNQDLVIALGLMREGNTWVRPQEGYLEVAHYRQDAQGRRLEIRAEHLRDYLAARNLALRVVSYRSREVVVELAGHIVWTEGSLNEGNADDRFEGRVFAIHEGGSLWGTKTAVFQMGRTDVDPEVDVPLISDPDDSNTKSRRWTAVARGRKLFRISGEHWRNEWVEPGHHSPRVRDDVSPSSTSFVVDAAGTRLSASDLEAEESSRWLWFRPELVNALVQRRGGNLEWYTRDTGIVGALHGYGVHFGLNTKDLVTAYAADVAKLPEWQLQLWAGFNVAPDGKVSAELLAAQMAAEPAPTAAPEMLFELGRGELDTACMKRWGQPLFREHPEEQNIKRNIHRFRAMNRAGLLELAKDLARLTADSIDPGPLQLVVPIEKSEKRGSLKSLERALATIVAAKDAHGMVGPLFGVWDLRLADAHLPSGELDKAFALVGVDGSSTWLRQGMQLIESTARVMHTLAEAILGNDTEACAPSPSDPSLTEAPK